MGKTSRKKPETKPAAPAILALVLSRFECLQLPPVENESEKSLMLEVAMTPFEPVRNSGEFFAHVMCRCSRTDSPKQPEVHLIAMYSVLARTGSLVAAEAEKEAKDWIASAVWQNFSNLFSVTNGQMHTEMPGLPLGPIEVIVRPVDYLLRAFNLSEDEVEELEAE